MIFICELDKLEVDIVVIASNIKDYSSTNYYTNIL